MENVKTELVARLQDVFDDVKMASTLLLAGKEVIAHRQLQGVRTKLVNLIVMANKGHDIKNVAEENTPTE